MRTRWYGFAALLMFVPVTLQAQAVVTGRVTNEQTGLPLPSAQVFIPELELGALSNASGVFTLTNVPTGSRTVTAQMLGYRSVSQTVTVVAGETVQLNFALGQEALALDELVVTGTAGGSQRRAVGAVVERVNVAEAIQLRPITSMEQALASTTPGVSIISDPGNVGGGGQIRLRGSSSAALSGDPIIYVDGVRMNADRGAVGRQMAVSRLQDIDPRDIENIEIIKGPAASTLYGTEAANGVINITTRRGVVGEPVFDASVELGASWIPTKYQTQHWAPTPACVQAKCVPTTINDLVRIDLFRLELARGYRIFDEAPIQRYNLGVRGGTDLIRYSASVSRNHSDGVTEWNWDTRTSARGSLGITANESLTINMNASYATGENSTVGESFFGANFGYGAAPTSALPVTLPDGTTFLNPDHGFSNPPDIYLSNVTKGALTSDRTTLSVELRHTPLEWLTHRLVFGVDDFRAQQNDLTYYDPEGIGVRVAAARTGSRSVTTYEQPVKTLDFSGTVDLDLTDQLNSQTSYGLQYYNKENRTLGSSGTQFATAALTTVTSAAVRDASESFVENTTVGVYVQEQIAWANRVFVTGAIRMDDNSAFGAGYDAAVYPKLSGTWVVSEEPFWNINMVNQFRLRAAWGEAGKQPDAFAAARLFRPVTGPGALPALTPQSFGNADLGPEVGSELEVGFDSDMFEGRLALNFTSYWRTTKDAIVAKPLSPSLGFTEQTLGSSVLVNLGEIKAWGTETAVIANLVDEPNTRWDMTLAFSTQHNEVGDLGEVERIPVQRGRSHAEGYPLASLIDYRVLSAEFQNGTRGNVKNVMCDSGTGPEGTVRMPGGAPIPCSEAPRVYWGTGEPTRIASLVNNFTLFQNWQVGLTIDYKGGHWIANDYLGARYSGYSSAQNTFLQDNPFGMAYITIARQGYTYAKGGFAKLREVTVAYTLPTDLAGRVGASRARVQAGIRNVATIWQAQAHVERERAIDPEMNRPDENFGGEAAGGWPPLSQITLSMSVSF